jgi:undecaprenyl-phosphate galactose phosphotransferase
MREEVGEGLPRTEVESVAADVAPADRSWLFSEISLRPLATALALMIADWCAVLACLVIAWWLRRGPLQAFFPELYEITPLHHFVARLYGLAPWLIAFAAARLYARRSLFWEETRRVVYACTLALFVAVAISFAQRRGAELSRLVLGGMWLTSIVLVPLVRLQAKRVLAVLGLWNKRVLIAGAGVTGSQVVERIRGNPDLGYEPIAFVDDDPAAKGGQCAGLPVHGPLESIPELVRALGVQDVVVAMPELPRERLYHLISICEGHVQSIRLVPDLFGLASVGVEAEDLDGILLLNMRWNLAKPWNVAVKRTFDVVVATSACLLLSPLLLMIAVAVRLDSPGPAFFVQERLGRGRRRFRCIKFRTMYVDNEERLPRHLAEQPSARSEWERFAKLKSGDPRVTRAGRLLRRWSLDELAQLVNVLRGEMSLVGPRPYLPSEAQRMGDMAETVLKAPPGMTGLWQVSGRNNLAFEQRLRLDEFYTRNWSLWLDVVILLKSAHAVVRGDGAY